MKSELDPTKEPTQWKTPETRPNCANCGLVLPWFINEISALYATPEHMAGKAKRLKDLGIVGTVDDEPPMFGRFGDNFVCGLRCGLALLVKLARAVGPADLLRILPPEHRAEPRKRTAEATAATESLAIRRRNNAKHRALLLIGGSPVNRIASRDRRGKRTCDGCGRSRVVFSIVWRNSIGAITATMDYPRICAVCFTEVEVRALSLAPTLYQIRRLEDKRVRRVLGPNEPTEDAYGLVVSVRGDFETEDEWHNPRVMVRWDRGGVSLVTVDEITACIENPE